MKLLVGNLPLDITDARLRELFGAHGRVGMVNLVADPEIGLGCAWALVEMIHDAEARAAIAVVNGMVVDGRPITVKESPDHGAPAGRGDPEGKRGWT